MTLRPKQKRRYMIPSCKKPVYQASVLLRRRKNFPGRARTAHEGAYIGNFIGIVRDA